MRISAEHYSLRPTTVQKNWLLTIQPQFLLAVQRSLIKHRVNKFFRQLFSLAYYAEYHWQFII